MIEQIISLIASHDCLQCGKEGSLLCWPCLQLLPPLTSHCYRCQHPTTGNLICKTCQGQVQLLRLIAATNYEGPAKQIVTKVKYARAVQGVKPMARLLASKIDSSEYDIITHIPTASSRIRQRGYDQAECLAQEISLILGLPHASLLARLGKQRQVGSQRQVRLLQLRTAFRPKHSVLTGNKRILLVDDVSTTGASIEAAATVLQRSGAKAVSAAVFAKA